LSTLKQDGWHNQCETPLIAPSLLSSGNTVTHLIAAQFTEKLP